MTLLQAKRTARRLGIAEHQIRWIMGRTHVGTPDDRVIEEMRGRTEAWPNEARDAADVLALAYHRRNQDEYRFVMGSH